VTVFQTERLDISPWTHEASDVERILDIYSRWEVAQWLGARPRTMATLAEASTAVERWAARCVGYQGVWAVRVRSTGLAAGTVLLVPLPDSAEVEVGWHFHPDSWGNGYATESARGAIAHGFAHGLREILAVVRPDNERSLAVCRRLGMTPLGLTEQWYDAELELFRSTPTAEGTDG
jgi:RimJ/RimL family protein N-acetyltransferase